LGETLLLLRELLTGEELRLGERLLLILSSFVSSFIGERLLRGERESIGLLLLDFSLFFSFFFFLCFFFFDFFTDRERDLDRGVLDLL
jgi:hypothetical protein